MGRHLGRLELFPRICSPEPSGFRAGLIANILAGPLVELAPGFAKAVAPGGSLLLAGLLAGFRMAARLQRGDWAILWLRRRKDWGERG